MQAIFMGLFAAIVVLADQLSKWWVVHNIRPIGPIDRFAEYVEQLSRGYGISWQEMYVLPNHKDVLPGIVQLSHTGNDGAAFSSFQGMQWLFAGIFVVFTVLVIWEYCKKAMPFTTFERWCIAAIYAGGLGNMIDRVRLGFVVDMIETQFITFPVFNVADCFITCGCILLMAHLVLFNRKFWKEDKK